MPIQLTAEVARRLNLLRIGGRRGADSPVFLENMDTFKEYEREKYGIQEPDDGTDCSGSLSRATSDHLTGRVWPG